MYMVNTVHKVLAPSMTTNTQGHTQGTSQAPSSDMRVANGRPTSHTG